MGDGSDVIQNLSRYSGVIVSDTVPMTELKMRLVMRGVLEVVETADVFGEAVRRIVNSEPLVKLQEYMNGGE